MRRQGWRMPKRHLRRAPREPAESAGCRRRRSRTTPYKPTLPQAAKSMGATLRAFAPTIRELTSVSQELKSTLEQVSGSAALRTAADARHGCRRPPGVLLPATRPSVLLLTHAAHPPAFLHRRDWD